MNHLSRSEQNIHHYHHNFLYINWDDNLDTPPSDQGLMKKTKSMYLIQDTRNKDIRHYGNQQAMQKIKYKY